MEESSKSQMDQHSTDAIRKEASLLGQSAEVRQAIFIYVLRGDRGSISLHPDDHYRRSYEAGYNYTDFTSFNQGQNLLLEDPLFYTGNRQISNEVSEAYVLANRFHSRSAAASLFLHKFLSSTAPVEGSDNKDTNHSSWEKITHTTLKAYYREIPISNHAHPSPTGLSWVRHLTSSAFQEDVLPSVHGHIALLEACPGIQTLTIAIDRSHYYSSTRQPDGVRCWTDDPPGNDYEVVAALGWESIAKVLRGGISLKTLVFDLRFPMRQNVGNHVLPHFSRETIPHAKTYLNKEAGLKNLEIVGKLWGKELTEVEQMGVSRAGGQTGEDDLEGVAESFLEEN